MPDSSSAARVVGTPMAKSQYQGWTASISPPTVGASDSDAVAISVLSASPRPSHSGGYSERISAAPTHITAAEPSDWHARSAIRTGSVRAKVQSSPPAMNRTMPMRNMRR